MWWHNIKKWPSVSPSYSIKYHCYQASRRGLVEWTVAEGVWVDRENLGLYLRITTESNGWHSIKKWPSVSSSRSTRYCAVIKWADRLCWMVSENSDNEKVEGKYRQTNEVVVSQELDGGGDKKSVHLDNTMVLEVTQDTADNIQCENVNTIAETWRTSTRNKKTPSIRGNDFLW